LPAAFRQSDGDLEVLMVRFTVQLFGITLFALGLIWFAGSGEAVQQSSANAEPVLWADTVHIDVEGNDAAASENEPTAREKRETFLQDIKKLTQTAFNVRNHYMEDIDTEAMIKSGIRGMLSDLDRYSVLMEKSSYDALMESTHGKYEGLGMQIDARDGHIQIITPIEGTPAYDKGLQAGDVIWEIDSISTDGMSSADAAKLMRGKAGTSIRLMIKRQGIADLLEFNLTRAIIELKSVNYFGVVPGTDIGYVRLSRFAEETSHELREAIGSLNDQNVSSLIFDLRSNGGGLLDQAKETAELFLNEGREIVYTKGKYENSERHYRSERAPIFKDKPLIVLVDAGTASASEIVSGAIQDWDRGLIVGTPTYGKGLVQQIFPISNDGSMALKLTTAKYYVPSGRCIQKPEKQGKPGAHNRAMIEEAEEAMDGEGGMEQGHDTLSVDDREIFYTNGGRIVYGGGGIVPDVEVDRETWKVIEINLERQSMFFDYAVKYVADHPDVTRDFVVTPEVLEDFRAFLKDREFDYKNSLEVSYDKLKETVDEENKTAEFEKQLADLHDLIELEKVKEFDESKDYISRRIKRAVVSSVAGERGVYEEIILRTDPTVKKAVDILENDGEYSKLIKEGQKKAEL
jgi:carboxyl-terminal processing protease